MNESEDAPKRPGFGTATLGRTPNAQRVAVGTYVFERREYSPARQERWASIAEQAAVATNGIVLVALFQSCRLALVTPRTNQQSVLQLGLPPYGRPAGTAAAGNDPSRLASNRGDEDRSELGIPIRSQRRGRVLQSRSRPPGESVADTSHVGTGDGKCHGQLRTVSGSAV